MTGDERLTSRLARERAARADAERIAEATTRSLYDRQRELELLRAVAAAANAAESAEEALAIAIGQVCKYTRWPLGHAFMTVPGGDELEPTGIWYVDDREQYLEFIERTGDVRFSPGRGLPGRVFETKSAVWISDVTTDPNFSRAAAAAASGIHSAFAFPVLAGAEVVAVLEFFSQESQDPDPALLAVMEQIGTQAGRSLERVRARQELQRLASQLRERNDDLERSNTDLERFAYIASHDLSEPLRMVTSYLQLLERRYSGQLDDDADEFIGFAVDGARRMQNLINDLLLYSRADRFELADDAADLGAVVEAVLAGLGTRLREAGAVVDVAPELPVVRGASQQLGQVLQNLVSNAVKFARPGGPPQVRIWAEESPAGWVVAVADDGIGIDDAERERVFEIFQRLHTREQYDGTGIGLAICRKIVERHGGRIWVEAGADGGSVFRFTLPR